MKKGKIVLVAICLMVILSIPNVSAYGSIYKKLEPEVITIDVNKERRERVNKNKQKRLFILLLVYPWFHS